MSIEKILFLLSATLALLLLQGNQVYMQVANLSCTMGDMSFENSTLDLMIHSSDVVMSGRVRSAEEGEFGAYSAVVSYYFAYKTDGLLLRRTAWYTRIVDFVRLPSVGQVGIFFLIRHHTMQLSLLCMSTEKLDTETIKYIKDLGISKFVFYS